MLDRSSLLHIRHIPGQPVTYLQNPKVGTKTIEGTLWHAHDPNGAPANPHAAKGSPFLRPNQLAGKYLNELLATKFFTVVRNPYARFLAGYLNKVAHRAAWRKIGAGFGMPPDSRLTIKEFLAVVKGRDAGALDHHFCPQHINVLHGIVPLDFVGHLERMEAVEDFLREHGMAVMPNRTFSTGANRLITERLDADDRADIRVIYEEDFRLFGYSEDCERLAPVADGAAVSGDRSTLRKHLSER